MMEMAGVGMAEAAETVSESTAAPLASRTTAFSPGWRSTGGLKKTGKGDPPTAEPLISTVSCPCAATHGQHPACTPFNMAGAVFVGQVLSCPFHVQGTWT